MSFINELNDIIRSDTKSFGYEQEQMMMKTGFDSIDYLNGQITIKDDGTRIPNLGIDAGKIVTIIGKSGSGKSTLALQMAANIIKKYDEGSMFVLDFEQSNTKDRIRNITGMSESYFNDHVTLKQTGISTNTVLRLVMQIRKLKMEHEKQLLVDNAEGVYDEDGKLRKILPPTVVVVDSLAMMMPDSQLDEEEIQGQMSATSMAKANTQLFKRLVQPCQEANIIMIFINHINAKVQITLVPTQAQLNYLGQDETLPGGNACIYLCNTLIKIITSTKLEEDKSYCIKGFEAKVQLLKSRTAPAGRYVNMIYNQREGFDQDLSMIDYLKSNGAIGGNGKAFFVQGMDDFKFRMANVKEKMAASPEFKEHVYKTARALMQSSISESSKITVIEQEPVPENIDEIILSEVQEQFVENVEAVGIDGQQ